jgi:AraC-like DNA-binding protein
MNTAYRRILTEQLDKLNLNYSLIGFGEVEIQDLLSNLQTKQLNEGLNSYGFEIVENQKSILIQKIKDAIREMVYMDEKLPTSKISIYLSDKLNYSYSYISKLFSDVTYTSIGNYILLQRTEFAKELLALNELNINEIAWRLNYSSTAHFSAQFKSVTGLTPKTFQRIINKKHNAIKNNQ